MAKSKTGELVKNTGILLVGNFSSKILVFLLVPLYTAVLSKEDVGSYDIIASSVQLLLPILTANIADAVMRFPLDDASDKQGIIRIGVLLSALSCLPVLCAQLMPGMPWSHLPGIRYLAALYASQSFSSLFLLFARGTEQVMDVAIAGVVGAVVSTSTNLWFLLGLKLGLDGYFLASILSNASIVVYLIIRLRRFIFSLPATALRPLARRMVAYSLPLALAPIGWWLVNLSDRFVVTALCGVAANGLYAVAYKIPSILNVIQKIFIQAWQISAVKEFDPEDSDGFLRNAYWTVEMFMVLSCSSLIALTPIIARIMFKGEFFEAWRYVPLLLTYFVANSSSGMLGAFFSAAKHTTPITVSVVVAGITNVVLGIVLVALIGIQGAAISSFVAGLVGWAYRAQKLKHLMSVNFRMKRTVCVYSFLALQGSVLITSGPRGGSVCLSLLFTVALLVYYWADIGYALASFWKSHRQVVWKR